MNRFDFETVIDRRGSGSLKGTMTPEDFPGLGLANFWGAEFDFPSCPAFSRGVMDCARKGLYAFTLQTPEYNARIVWWMEHARACSIQPEWIVPTHGTIYALATAIRLFVGPGSHMLMLTPGYSRYAQAATRLQRACHACALSYDAEAHRYSVDWEKLEQQVSDPNCALLVICQPNNPTGTVLTEQELRRIDQLARQYGTAVFCDEIFGEISLTDHPVPSYAAIMTEDSPAMVCTSLGKCMSLTGVNHANLLIRNPSLRERYTRQKYADHYGSLDPMLYAGLMQAYSEEGLEWLKELLCVIRSNRKLFTEQAEALFPGAHAVQAEGTYVVWMDYSDCGMTEEKLKSTFQKIRFLGDPGSEYGASDMFWRYSVAMPAAQIQRTMDWLRSQMQV